MGTVGLNFGTPTSGAGFNVSQTVSEIVANLQNVETPWQNQLTSLHSQDAVISSLGALYSSLSNDLSQLTDFSGVLAQKTGSSSNTNVLELTAASNTATAGTHSVTVNSLATTSSGFTGEISSSSAALTGAITLQMGSGTAETFVIGDEPSSPTSNTTYTGSADNTLVGLASAINASDIGITANVESDSSGSWLSLTSQTSGAGGNILGCGRRRRERLDQRHNFNGNPVRSREQRYAHRRPLDPGRRRIAHHGGHERGERGDGRRHRRRSGDLSSE
jgi:flagellar hook-associated protein 2